MSPDPQQHDQFVELLRQHQNQLFGYLLALVRNLADAEDLFQQTTLVLWRKFDQFQEGSNFLAWACNIARLEAANFRRRARRSPLRFSEELQAELAVISSESDAEAIDRRRTALAGCLEVMSPPDRLLIETCYGGEASIAQLATQWGRSRHSVYNSLRRIRQALLSCIERKLKREESA